MEQGNDKLELVYGLEDKPSPMESAYAAMQHLLAIIVGIITPTLIIGGVLGLGERIPYLISMSLIISTPDICPKFTLPMVSATR